MSLTIYEQEQASIIREQLAEIQELRDENRQLEDANHELDAELNNANRNIVYLETRLALEKAGWHCTCGGQS